MINKKVMFGSKIYKLEDSFFNPLDAKGASVFLQDKGKETKLRKDYTSGKWMLFSR